MPYASNGDTRLFYERAGNGTPLILLMGLGGTLRAWGLQWTAFSLSHDLLAMDNRGAGRSDKPADGYSVAAFAADLAAVMDHAGIHSAHILGISLGGLVAQEFFHRHPDRVRSLTLCATGVGVNDTAGVPPTAAVTETLALDPRTTPAQELLQRHVETFYHPDYVAHVPDLVDRLKAFHAMEPQPAHGYKGQLHAIMSHEPNSPRLHRIHVPTLVLHGADDRVWPPANGRYLARHITGARLLEVPGAAHMLPLEKPLEFNQAVLHFLGDVDNSQRTAAPDQN